MNSILRWFSNSQITDPVEKRNFINVQIDAVGVGLASASAPFLPVFLTLLGASNFQVGLLTSMPAITGFLLAIPMGRFLQNQLRVVPWFSASRLLVVACYALTGLAVFILPPGLQVAGILAVWAMATLPQTMVSICFSVVMNAVAGPKRRFDLMSRRWSILGFTTAITAVLIGQVLDRVSFPNNFQIVFMALSIGGLISYRFSSHIDIPQNNMAERKRIGLIEQYKDY
ncbi:MAG TPA: hypothetical protein VHO48_10115, partial [Anaerolineaceae bacterium]|nr:hypothetical protein [Anaerolineaceae bacterium]